MYSKIKWRMALLRDPVQYLNSRRLLDRIDHPPLREALERSVRNWSLSRRLRLITPGTGARPDMTFLLTTRLCQTSKNELYFDTGSLRIFFQPGHAVSDEAEMLRGAMTIIAEAYVRPPEFFFGAVQLSPGDVVLDLGGNLGTSAILFSDRVKEAGRVISFEPIFHKTLRRNLRENNISNVEVVAAAVSDNAGEIDFSVTEAGIDSRMNGDGKTSRTLRVPMTTLDQFASDRDLTRLDFIKLDIEGAEEMALRGGEETIRRHRPKLSIASYHTDPQGDAQHPKLVTLLRNWGYRTHEKGREHIYAWAGE